MRRATKIIGKALPIIKVIYAGKKLYRRIIIPSTLQLLMETAKLVIKSMNEIESVGGKTKHTQCLKRGHVPLLH